MMGHTHTHCAHCGCNNVLTAALGERLLASGDLVPALKAMPTGQEAPQPQSQIIVGTIRPMTDGRTDSVEALGVHEGLVVACGDEADVTAAMEALSVPYATRYLQAGQVLLPGLIEPHLHLVASALMAAFEYMGPFDGQSLKSGYGPDDLKQTVVAKARATLTAKSGHWVLGREVDPALMPFTVSPDGKLNALVTINAVFLDDCLRAEDPALLAVPVILISASMHTAYANTAAMQAIFNAREYKNYATVEDYIAAVHNGQLQESEQILPALECIPPLQLAGILKEMPGNLGVLFETAVSRGATLLYDAGLDGKQLEILKTYLDLAPGGFPVRVGGALVAGAAADIRTAYTPAAGYQPLYLGHIKVVSDGSNQGLTGYQVDPYCCEPAGNRGFFNFPKVAASQPETIPDSFQDILTAAVSKNWSLMVHANGDQAVAFTTGAYARALSGLSPEQLAGRRDRIEHCSLLSPDCLNTMADLNISPSFLIGHVGYWGYAFDRAIFGADKASSLDLCHSALEKGLRISLHCDYSVSPLGPLRQMEQSVTRIMEADPDLTVLNAAECLTREEGLRAITYDAAWQCRAEAWAGMLAPGYYADFVILAQDPLTAGLTAGLTDSGTDSPGSAVGKTAEGLSGRADGDVLVRDVSAQAGAAPETTYQVIRNIPVVSTWKGGAQVYPR